MDPYVVTSLLAETTILYEPTLEAEALAAQKLSMNVWYLLVEDNLKRLREHHLDLDGLHMGNFSHNSPGKILVNKDPDVDSCLIL